MFRQSAFSNQNQFFNFKRDNITVHLFRLLTKRAAAGRVLDVKYLSLGIQCNVCESKEMSALGIFNIGTEGVMCAGATLYRTLNR